MDGTDGEQKAHLTRLDLNNASIERSMRFLGQINLRMTNLKRKPENIKKLIEWDFYSRLFKN
jgi:hypothetical protein